MDRVSADNQKNENGTKHYHYISILKTIAMFAVVILHVVSAPVRYWATYYNNIELFFSIFFHCILVIWAVPVFVMVSGALFLNPNKEISLKKLFTKYISRLLIVLFTIGCFFALLEIVFNTKQFEVKYLLTSFINVLQGKCWNHMWYLYMLIGLYIVTPILKIITQNFQKKDYKYLFFILLIFNCLFPTINELFDFKINFYLPFAGIYIFYYILGYCLHEDIFKIPHKACWISIIICILYYTLGQFIPNNVSLYGASIKLIGNYSPFAIISSVSIFVLVKDYSKANENIFEKIATLSFGVYIFHPVFINFILKFLKLNPSKLPVILIELIVLVTTVFGCFGITWLLRKIPFVRKYVL